jgi:hypothetical protein
MAVYELVIRYETKNDPFHDKTVRRIFSAGSDDIAKKVAQSDHTDSLLESYGGYFVRLTRIDAFATYDENGLVSPQKETHLLRYHAP